MRELRIDHDTELIVYAAKKITIAISHLDDGDWLRVSRPDRVNHVSKPVDAS